MIELLHLQKAYPNSTPLKDVCATIHKGDVIAVIGASGCGKSTLLRCINMLDPPTGGKIIVSGEDITAPGYDLNRLRMKVGMIFQSFNLFLHQSIIENVMQPQMKLLGRSKQEAYDKAYSLLSVMGLSKQQFQFPDQISGGQQQRVAIARALAMDPDILLLDEPTSALDPTMVGEVEAVIYELAKRGTTMLLVTHDMNFARSVSNRVFYMDEGGIYEDGTPEQIFHHPQKEKTRRFIRGISSLTVNITNGEFDLSQAVSDIEKFASRQGLDARTGHKLVMIFEELCAIYFPEKTEKNFCASVVFEYNKEEEAVVLSIDHNAGLISEEDLLSDISFVIVRRLIDELEQTPVAEQAGIAQYRMTLTVKKGGGKQNED
ncbi:MAG: amino acid ABC transporter ATP-binding protein [Clostridia bacterium]|nr:amino acid ABC transporter ATP-binding protein [Clostridia bacterium]MBO7295715.1 amino acid ABC transporter ATP-binding protein [Clostridia bacterium]